jgi:hypothetical protein
MRSKKFFPFFRSFTDLDGHLNLRYHFPFPCFPLYVTLSAIMLKIFRQNTKVVIWITVAALALLFGAGSIVDLVNGKKSGRFAGEAFGKSVTFQEYNKFYRATQLFMPSEKPVEDPELLRNYTWQNIIYSREAKHRGIKITDEEVRKEISKILAQQGLVNPTSEQYKIWLTRALHLSPREFEEGLREFLRIQKLLRMQIASFVPAGVDKLTDPKAKEEAATKQKLDFMAWTNDVNKRADLKDYLALPGTPQEELPPEEELPPQKKLPASEPKK